LNNTVCACVVCFLVVVGVSGRAEADGVSFGGADLIARNGDWIAGRATLGYSVGAFGTNPQYPVRVGPFARAELALGGASGGVGFASFVASLDMPPFVLWALTLEAKVMRTWWSTWPTATFLGGEVGADVAWMKFGLAVLRDVGPSQSGVYVRAGIGFGFGL
jgi:hypothetical protein